MKFVIYMACDFEVLEPGEIDHHVQFSHVSPMFEDKVIMGGDRIWQVVETISYYELGSPTVLEVILAYVHPVGLTPKTMLQLTRQELEAELLPMSLEVALDDETKEIIQVSIGFDSDVRPVGTRLFQPVQIEGTARFEAKPIDYWIKENSSYAPMLPNKFERVHLSYCQRRPVAELSAA